jgi:mRNA interferase MazF
MKRGEIWTVAGDKDYAGKPRPVVILQDDRFDATVSVTVCAFTTDPTEAPLFRIPIQPNKNNGLRALRDTRKTDRVRDLCAPSCLMADRITTVSRTKLGYRVGDLGAEDMARLARSVIVFLNLIETA